MCQYFFKTKITRYSSHRARYSSHRAILEWGNGNPRLANGGKTTFRKTTVKKISMGKTPKLSRVGKKGGALHGGGSLKFWGL